MPPIRTASNPVKQPPRQPAKTERTHEENQERAYIAASRRSDRSIEARVESARRASEIHKKRTGRSLRVTERDVENEEMYEEEDDDLPMRYQRFNALHPGQTYSAFADRVSNYMYGQIGMRNYLHEAIYHANQNTAQHRHFNTMMLQQQHQLNPGFTASPTQNTTQPTYPPNQLPQPDANIIQTESFSYSPSQQQAELPAYPLSDARSMSLSLPSPGSRRTASIASASPVASTPTSLHMQPPDVRSRTSNDESDPLSSTLPLNQQQLLDGNPSFMMGVHASQMTPGASMPSTYQYQFDETLKTPGSSQIARGHSMNLGLTLTPQDMQNVQHAQSMPPTIPEDVGFGNDPEWYNNDDLFDFSQGGSYTVGGPAHSGQVTPGDEAWNPDDFFEYPPAST